MQGSEKKVGFPGGAFQDFCTWNEFYAGPAFFGVCVMY